MFKIEINTEMTDGHKFCDVIYAESYDNAFIEDIMFSKAKRRGFKESEVFIYEVIIKSNI